MSERTGTIRWLVWAHLVLLVCVWLIPLYAYQSLPDTIPVHFNASGEPDSYAAKSSFSFWVMPLVATVMGIIALVLLRYPHIYNHPRKKDVQELPAHLRPPIYRLLQEMLLWVFICVDLTMIVIQYAIVASAAAGRSALDVIWILVFPLAPLAVLLVYLPRVSRTVDALKERAHTEPDPASKAPIVS
jgi:uncharacterized membrane protein